MNEPAAKIVTRLNLETGQISWPELQRYFAGGRMLVLQPKLDLVKTAAAFVDDDAETVSSLLAEEKLAPASTEQAREWQQSEPLFWAVVAAPWVLVQEIISTADQ